MVGAIWSGGGSRFAVLPCADFNMQPKLDHTWTTPIEAYGSILVKREDLFGSHRAGGAKLRALLIEESQAPPDAIFVAAASQHTAMQVYVAEAARLTQRRALVFAPLRKEPTPSTLWCIDQGVEYRFQTPGYMSQLQACARRYRKEAGAPPVIPFSRGAAVAQTALQTANVKEYGPQRIIVPVGSGLTLLGIIKGCAERGIDVEIRGYPLGSPAWPERALMSAGVDPAQYLYQAPGEPLSISGLPLDGGYAARLGGVLAPGDLLWNIGQSECREVVPAEPARAAHKGHRNPKAIQLTL